MDSFISSLRSLNIFITVILKSSSCGSATVHFSMNTVEELLGSVLDVVDCFCYGVYNFKTKQHQDLETSLDVPPRSLTLCEWHDESQWGVSPGHIDGVSRAVLL